MKPWKTRLKNDTEIPARRFNGATAMKPWKTMWR